jgi:RNA recognition motif-containing protein
MYRMTTIFVGNLSFQTTDAELEHAFARYGRVSSVRIVTDRGSGSPRGFAFVQMPGMDDAEEAIARMNGQSIGGRSITVNEAQSRDNSRTAGPIRGGRSALLDSL